MSNCFRKLVSLVILTGTCFIATAQLAVQHLRTENLHDPIGIDIIQPHFSWQLSSASRNVMQAAYEIRLGDDATSLSKGSASWKTVKVVSDKSVLIPYAGPPLVSGKRYVWQVRVWDESGKSSAWSAPAYFQMGLLRPSDWKAAWIVPGFKEDSMRPAPLLRKEFTSKKKVRTATAYITAHGLYEAQINGKRVGDAYLAPGWTSYNKRLQYQAVDVTTLLMNGANAIGVTLGDGWYRGSFSFDHSRNHYGKDIALLFQLEILFTDGTTETIVSDGTWKSSTGAIRNSEIYSGETIDARHDKKGWAIAGYNDNDWSSVKVENYSKDHLIATYNECIKKQETLKPFKILKTPKGEQVIDFGQNLVGWVVVKAHGKAGDKITISHAEVLDKNGNFYTDNLRRARAQDTYFLSGEGEETFEPHFTWHGFRYIKVDGYPGELKPENFTAVALYSDIRQAGNFTTSNKLINQLQHNIEWGLRGNFLDVPTDCPQRDERMGWTGDAQVFFRTSTFLRDVKNFFTKWMKDVSADQMSDGKVPWVIPNVLGNNGGSAGWADVATIIPWQMYEVYGDKRILEDQYAGMKAWVDFMQSKSRNYLWNQGPHFGDWLFYSLDDDNDGRSAITNKYFIAQCFYAHSTQLLVNAANVLGKTADAAKYSELLGKIKEAFVSEYLTRNGATMSNTQTSYVLALHFDMLPEAMRQQAADRLVQNIKDYGNHLTTGFLGTPYLCHVLSRFGYSDVAYTLLLQESFPSWLYPVKMGATTIWERWDGIKPNGNFEVPSMNSFNHYAYGAIGDWMYRVMAGIDNDTNSVGYKQIRIKPHVGGGFTHVKAEYESVHGKISSEWKVENKKLVLNVEVPPNTTATIHIPAGSVDAVSENNQKLTELKDLRVVGAGNGYVLVKVGSGKYQFSVL